MRFGPWELGIVLALALLIFGPSKLPGLGKSVGDFIKNFKKSVSDVEKETKDLLPKN